MPMICMLYYGFAKILIFVTTNYNTTCSHDTSGEIVTAHASG